MSAATKTVPSPSNDSAPTRDCPEPTMRVSERDATPSESSPPPAKVQNPQQLSREVSMHAMRVKGREHTAWLLVKAIGWQVLEGELAREEGSGGVCVSDLKGCTRAPSVIEEMEGLAAEFYRYGGRLESAKEALGDPKQAAKIMRGVADDLEEAQNDVGLIWEAQKYDAAMGFLRKAYSNKGPEAKVAVSSVTFEAETPYANKRLKMLQKNLHDDFTWTIELARRAEALADDKG